MRPWERRLKDLSQILMNCESAYFDPEQFRMNTNHFLQTSRTVTFIIQKNKAEISSFDAWYGANVLAPWAKDPVMTWAKDSRNTIEKEGDLDLHSSLTLSLIFSYFDHEDVNVACGRTELVGANIKRLIRFARTKLPSGISDAAVVRVERRWVANSLSDWELLNALRYIYGRIHHVVASLGKYLGAPLDKDVPSIGSFSSLKVEAKRTSYMKLNDLQPARMKTKSVQCDKNFVPPASLSEWMEKRENKPAPGNFQENVDFYAECAQRTFGHFGNHVPMLFMFDDQFRPIDFVSAHFDDQATKYLFWRSMADRVLYLKPHSVIFICESWRRSLDKGYPSTPMRKLPILGESLQVVGIDYSGNTAQVTWNIIRDGDKSKPRLEFTSAKDEVLDMAQANFFHPIRKSFHLLSSHTSVSPVAS